MIQEDRYFFLNRECYLVKGHAGGAIYNLYTGDIYAIDNLLTTIIDYCENNGLKIIDIINHLQIKNKSDILNILVELNDLELGEFYEDKIYIEKIKAPITKEQQKAHFQSPKFEFLWLKISEICNLNCIHCITNSTEITHCSCNMFSSKMKLHKSKLSITDLKEIISEAAILKLKNISFIGGEPLLLKKNLIKLLEHARNVNIENIVVHTNCILIDDELLDVFADLKISLKSIFFTNNANIYDKITRVNGSYFKLIRNISKIIDRNINVNFDLLIMKHNQDYLSETMAFIKSYDVNLSKIQILHTQNKELCADRVYGHLFIEDGIFPKINRSQFFRFREGNSCWDGKIAVFFDGSIHPCIMAQNHCLGNVKEDSLITLISRKNQVSKYWDLTKDKIEGCRDCEFRYACPDCRVLESVDGSLYGKNKYCNYNPSTGIWGSYR